MRTRRSSLFFWVPVVILSSLILFLFLRVLLPNEANGGTGLLDSLLSFRCKASISYGEMEATADIVRSLDGTTRITLNTPEALNGLQFDFSESNVSLNFKGMKLDVEPSSFLASSMASVMVGAVESALQDENLNTNSKDGVLTVTSKNETGNFTLTLDEETGAPLSLSVPSLNLDCNFTEFQPAS